MGDSFIQSRKAAKAVSRLDGKERCSLLLALADELEKRTPELLEANLEDVKAMPQDSPLLDRLRLDEDRIRAIASDMCSVASLPDPLGLTLEDRTLPNGLRLRKVSVPFGVVGVIYEARPNVTFDVFSLCFKSGNACILKGGRDASNSNAAAVRIIKDVLSSKGITPEAVNLLPPTHEAADELLGATGYVDLVIPRGGRKLIDFVRNNSRVPYIETGAGVVHTYIDADADTAKATAIVCNAKTRRVSVCNALDCLIVNKSRLGDLPAICAPLETRRVDILADDPAYEALEGNYDGSLLKHSIPSDYGTEFMAYRMAVKTVADIHEAIEHIGTYGSGHSECIVTEDAPSAETFRKEIDAACVYVNAPTSFTDGAQFGLGAEIGISTQKLGARGPMGLREITTYKWLIDGNGQVRK